jgi:predicted nucleotidyltransferase
MRLTNEQISAILETTTKIGGRDVEVLLFGSRLDDSARGGDVDLIIETDAGLSVLERARIKATLEERLGLPVDIVAVQRQRQLAPCQRIAKSGAVRLEADP